MASPSPVENTGAVGVGLTRRGWAFVAASGLLFAVAYSNGWPGLLYAAGLLGLLPLWGAIFVAVRRPRLAVTRVFAPHVIAAGSVASVSLVVRNLAPTSTVRARWSDTVPWAPRTTPLADLPELHGHDPHFASHVNVVAIGYELAAARRGVFTVGPLTVLTTDPFGLASRKARAGGVQSIVVTPEVVPLPATGIVVPAGDGESRLVQRRATGDDDDTMTREYRAGDAMRRVHWRATARKGDLMVRQEEQRSFPQTRIVIDTRRTGYRQVSGVRDGADGDAAFEWGVRMLASVAVHLRRAGFLVTVEETSGGKLDAISRGGRRHWHDEEFLVNLASLALTASPPLPATDRSSTGPLVALLGVPEPSTVEWVLKQRGVGNFAVAFIVHRNPGGPAAVESGQSGQSGQSGESGESGMSPDAAAAVQRMRDEGWLVVPVQSDDDLAAAWGAVAAETGRAHGAA